MDLEGKVDREAQGSLLDCSMLTKQRYPGYRLVKKQEANRKECLPSKAFKSTMYV